MSGIESHGLHIKCLFVCLIYYLFTMFNTKVKLGKSLPLIAQKISTVNSMLINGEVTVDHLFNQCNRLIQATQSLNAFVNLTQEIAKTQMECSSKRYKEGNLSTKLVNY